MSALSACAILGLCPAKWHHLPRSLGVCNFYPNFLLPSRLFDRISVHALGSTITNPECLPHSTLRRLQIRFAWTREIPFVGHHKLAYLCMASSVLRTWSARRPRTSFGRQPRIRIACSFLCDVRIPPLWLWLQRRPRDARSARRDC